MNAPASCDPQEQAFIDAIAADPDSDDLRLVYADLLEARGDPRGEFIQLQCQIARLPADDPRRPVLSLREQELDRAHAKEWLGALWSLELPRTKFGYRRGCLEIMAAPFAVATLRANQVLARGPLLATFDLFVDGQADRVQLASPRNPSLLARARELSIEGRHKGNTLRGRGPIGQLDGLATVPFTRLRRLSLSNLRANELELAELLASAHLASLEELSLHLALHGPALVTALSRPSCTSLRRLDLGRNPLGDDGVVALAQSNLLGLVTHLDLDRTQITLAGLRELLEGDRLENIESLGLGWNPVLGDGAALLLASWSGGAKLREIFLRGSNVTQAGHDALLGSARRGMLRSVTIE